MATGPTEVVKLTYNWRQVSDGQMSGEDYDYFELGYSGVSRISMDRNDQRLATVYFDDGSKIDINNVNMVYWKAVE